MAMRIASITAQLGRMALSNPVAIVRPFSSTSAQFKKGMTKAQRHKIEVAEKKQRKETRLAEKARELALIQELRALRDSGEPMPEDKRATLEALEAELARDPRIPTRKPEHGLKIYVFHHIMDGMTVYSHDPVMKATRALKQLPFVGKQMKPSKIRKDYWRPLAMIQFPEGQNRVGLSVNQLLRECKQLHQYSWDDCLLFGERRFRTKRERGIMLNDQRANTVADMAAILNGLGKGNHIVIDDPSKEVELEEKAEDEDLRKKVRPARDPVDPEHVMKMADGRSLMKVTVWWADEEHKEYAEKWSENVTHYLFDDATLAPTLAALAPAAKEAEAEAVAESS